MAGAHSQRVERRAGCRRCPGHDLPPSGGKQERRVRLAELVRAGKAYSGLKECKQVGVELLLVRVREAVGCALVDLQGRVLDQLR